MYFNSYRIIKLDRLEQINPIGYLLFYLEEEKMAINNVIDLDAKLSLTKSIKIAGKVYDITISDEVDQVLTDLLEY